MPSVSLLIKPASSNCNLKCKYCFYRSIAENRSVASYGMMQTSTLEVLVKKALEFADDSCTFAFQGGEPTLSGLGFFAKLTEYENRYNAKKVDIHNALQTNGTLIDEEWAKFLRRNGFLVGISLDGPRDIHNANRVDAFGKGSFARVMKTTELFNRYGVEYNILSVVNSYMAGHAGYVYNFFKKRGFKFLQFIPCLDPLEEIPGGHEFSLSPQKYAVFLKELFDLWYQDLLLGEPVSIRYFDNLLGIILGYPPEECGMIGQCRCQLVVEADGGVYPCDFYVTDEWRIGNIIDLNLDEMLRSDTATRFVDSSMPVDDKCTSCKWAKLCGGGCRRNREPFLHGRPALNYFCPSFIDFFDYAYGRLCRAADLVSQRY